MSRGEPLLTLSELNKRFGGLKVISDLDLEVRAEETVGLIGPNGAGKSTVFNLITSIYRPDSGWIRFRDRDITGLAPHRICDLGIARTYQLVRVFLKMTVEENVMTAAVYGGRREGSSSRERTAAALELVELSGRAEAKAASLTLSQRRLLEIAMALASSPSLILLDEPMAGLTSVEIEHLLGIIRTTQEERRFAILWIEHRVDEVLDFCERVAVLDYGAKIADGKPVEVASDPKVIEAYLGEPAA